VYFFRAAANRIPKIQKKSTMLHSLMLLAHKLYFGEGRLYSLPAIVQMFVDAGGCVLDRGVHDRTALNILLLHQVTSLRQLYLLRVAYYRV